MFALLRSDIQRYQKRPDEAAILTVIMGIYSHPSLMGLVWYRVSRPLWLHRRNPAFLFLLIIMRALYPFIRFYSGLELAPSVDLGPGAWIGHFGHTVISPYTKIGSHFTLLQGVTIGVGTGGIPTFGDNVSVGTGATIIGGIHIGDNVTIGAGAVVTRDVPDDSLAIGVPAQSFPKNN